MQDLVIRGAREHNLKGIDLVIPRNAFVVFTGVSGSGKSTLAFDTIYAEGQRRYVESLSAYARQFLGHHGQARRRRDRRPLARRSRSTRRPPATTRARPSAPSPRSTTTCACCSRASAPPTAPSATGRSRARSASEIVDRFVRALRGQARAAPGAGGARTQGRVPQAVRRPQAEGFVRVRVDGGRADARGGGLGRPRATREARHRGRGRPRRRRRRRPRPSGRVGRDRAPQVGEGLRARRPCPTAGSTSCTPSASRARSTAPSSRSSSRASSPSTAPTARAPQCSGLGTLQQFDLDLLVPDPYRSIAGGAIAPWTGVAREGGKASTGTACGARRARTRSTSPPRGATCPAAFQRLVLHGAEDASRGRLRRAASADDALQGASSRGSSRTSSAAEARRRRSTRARSSRATCRSSPARTATAPATSPRCSPCAVADRNIADVVDLTVVDARSFFGGLELPGAGATIARPILREVIRPPAVPRGRRPRLPDARPHAPTRSRAARRSASGSRPRSARGLIGVLYVLDEPSIGLHPRDNDRLLRTLLALRDLGNTVIVVEHDEETMRAADYIVDLGPGAGRARRRGRRRRGAGADWCSTRPRSPARYLRGGAARSRCPTERRAGNGKALKVVGAREHNLRDVTVEIPLGTLTCVTGRLGLRQVDAGQRHPPRRARQGSCTGPRRPRARTTESLGSEHVDKVIEIDQTPDRPHAALEPGDLHRGLHRRSATCSRVLPESRKRGYKPGRFSFNVKGGRCEACEGDGTVKVEMHFLPDVYVPCEVCEGARYNRETLEVTIRGQVDRRRAGHDGRRGPRLLRATSRRSRASSQLLQDVGLGYMQLGQPATTLSGGEAQRVKLAAELGKRSTGRTLYILDEPTTGLHFDDIAQAARRAPPPGGRGQHGGRDRAQPRRDQDRRLDHRPRPRRRRPRRPGRRHRHARSGRAPPDELDGGLPAQARRPRRAARGTRGRVKRAAG